MTRHGWRRRISTAAWLAWSALRQTSREIARQFEVSHTYVGKLIRGKSRVD